MHHLDDMIHLINKPTPAVQGTTIATNILLFFE